jgi:hypothetical protein
LGVPPEFPMMDSIGPSERLVALRHLKP